MVGLLVLHHPYFGGCMVGLFTSLIVVQRPREKTGLHIHSMR